MPLILFHTKRVRQALATPESLVIDVVVLIAVGALIASLISFGRQFTAPYQATTVIDLSFSSLPKYTFFSLCRGFAAYILSLAFTLIYGTIAAHNHRAEKVMMPVLDVLQAIPVLGFLPGLVLAMIALFPTREMGLEIACIVMIFTGQAWNMVFSFHGSLRGIPQPLREVAALQRLGGWKTFKLLEVPAAMIGLVWNSMMSMAGGWFFLTVNEAFTLGTRDFRLPGIGSYMNEAINKGNTPAMIAAIFAMIIMIVVVDQIFWRPIVVWCQKYKLEESAEADKPQSWVLNLLAHSKMYEWILHRLARPKHAPPPVVAVANQGAAVVSPRDVEHNAERKDRWAGVRVVARWLVVAVLICGAGWGSYQLTRLLTGLPIHDRVAGEDWLHVLAAAGRIVRAHEHCRVAGCGVGAAGGDSYRLVAALVAETATDHPSDGEFPRADALSAGDDPARVPARSVHGRMRRPHAARSAVVYPVQRDSRRDSHSWGLKGSGRGLPDEPHAPVDKALRAVRLSVSGDGTDHRRRRRVERDDCFGVRAGEGPDVHGVRARVDHQPRDDRRELSFAVRRGGDDGDLCRDGQPLFLETALSPGRSAI